MNRKNIEFKAKVESLETYEEKLKTLNPLFVGLDHQVDTYFNVPNGRLKLREGNIENALINYNRAKPADAKLSDIILYQHKPDAALKQILQLQLGVKAVVDKQRKIYFINNVKFHFDQVQGLGTFLEVEVIDEKGNLSIDEMKKDCDHYFQFFGLSQNQLVDRSYSDLILIWKCGNLKIWKWTTINKYKLFFYCSN